MQGIIKVRFIVPVPHRTVCWFSYLIFIRWQPVTPLSKKSKSDPDLLLIWLWNRIDAPHSSTADDTYNGYFIPKETIVVGNAWLFMHDPAVYSDPYTFKPERFLGDNPERDPDKVTFGFGRRWVFYSIFFVCLESRINTFCVESVRDDSWQVQE